MTFVALKFHLYIFFYLTVRVNGESKTVDRKINIVYEQPVVRGIFIYRSTKLMTRYRVPIYIFRVFESSRSSILRIVFE